MTADDRLARRPGDYERFVEAIFDARKARQFYPDGSVGEILPPEHHTPHHLLTGILRCGRIRPDGSLCNSSKVQQPRRTLAIARDHHHHDGRNDLAKCTGGQRGIM